MVDRFISPEKFNEMKNDSLKLMENIGFKNFIFKDGEYISCEIKESTDKSISFNLWLNGNKNIMVTREIRYELIDANVVVV